MDLIRGKIKEAKDRSGKTKTFSAEGRIDETLEGRELFQQKGFSSIPEKDDEVIVLSLGNLRIAIASESKDRPALEPGEAAVYSSAENFIRFKKDGTIEIVSKGKKLTIDADVEVSGEITAQTATAPVKLSTHLHPTPVGPSSAPTPGT